MKRKNLPFPVMNLQFFAEDISDPEVTDPKPNTDPEPTPDPDPEPQLSVEEQLQQMRVENAKLKKLQEKAASEAAEYKKQLRAKQSADEIALQEKAEKEAERDEQFKQLLKENEVNKLEKNFLALGYPEDKANLAAIAQYDGDTDTLFKIQSEMQQALVKQKEAEWLKSRPEVSTGAGDEKPAITREQFEKLGYSARVEFKRKYPQTYKAYTK